MNREDCDLYEYLTMNFATYSKGKKSKFFYVNEKNPYFIKICSESSNSGDTVSSLLESDDQETQMKKFKMKSRIPRSYS